MTKLENGNQDPMVLDDPFKDETILDQIKFFFQNTIMGKGDAEYERKKLLKKIRKEIKQYETDVYNFKSNTLTADFAVVLFDLYRYLNPLKSVINLNDKLQRMRVENFFVEKSFNEVQQKLLESLSEKNLALTLSMKSVKDLDLQINNALKDFQKSFLKDKVREINLSFSRLVELNDLVHFDLYGFIKKFAPALKENMISNPPKFRELEGKYAVEELRDFSELIYSMDFTNNFHEPIQILGEFKGSQIVSYKDIDNFISLIKKTVTSNIFSYLLSYMYADPHFKPVQNIKVVNLTQLYFKNFITTVKTRRDRVVKVLRDSKINSVVKELFGTDDIKPLDNYNHEHKEKFDQLELNHFTCSEALSFIKLFIVERYNRYIRELLNQLSIQGLMVNEDIQQEISHNYSICNHSLKEITSFDDSLSEKTPLGAKVKGLMRKAQIEANSKRMLDEYIVGNNIKARGITKTSIMGFDAVAQILKTVVEDYKQGKSRVVNNIKEINGAENKKFINDIVKSFNEISKLSVLVKAVIPGELKEEIAQLSKK